jgi:hypothetical protein
MPDFGIMRGFNEKLFGDKLVAGQLPTQLGLIGSQEVNDFLLDLYPNSAAAYSVRKLTGTYTGNAIRVRRSSDNTEQDIGFSSGNLDTTALTTFCSGTNGFVTTWYDQSGNARNATQTTAANQPQIVSSGSVLIKNLKPTIKFDNVDDKLLFNLQWANVNFDIFTVLAPINKTFSVFISEGDGEVNYTGLGHRNLAWSLYNTGVDTTTYPISFSSDQQYLTNFYKETAIKLRVNNGSEFSRTISALSNSNSVLGAGTGNFFNGNIQEVILYQSNQTSNRTGISTNINSYYGIY